MRTTFICLALALLALSSEARADFFGRLFGGRGGIECAPADAGCLRDAAYQIALAQFREGDENERRNLADDFARLMRTDSDGGRLAVQDQLRELGANEEFFGRLEDEIDPRSPGDWITPGDLRSTLATGISAGSAPTDRFLRAALEVLLTRNGEDAAEALAIALEHRARLYTLSAEGYDYLIGWTAGRDADALVTLLSGPRPEQSTAFYEAIGYGSYRLCSLGDAGAAGRILDATLPDFDAEWRDPVLKGYGLANLFATVLSCRGEAEAQELAARIDAMEPEIMAFLEARYPDANQRAFVEGAVRDYIAERVSDEYAFWLYQAGREDEAIRLHAARGAQGTGLVVLPGEGLQAGLDTTAAAFTWDDFLRIRRDAPFYSEDPADLVTALAGGLTLDTSICCAWQQIAGRILDAVETEWPSGPARKSATILLETWAEASQSQSEPPAALHAVQLTVGRLRLSDGCAIPQAVLEEILTAAPDYRYDFQRIDVLSGMVEYAVAAEAAGASVTGPCD